MVTFQSVQFHPGLTYTMSQKTAQNFLSQLRQIFINFDNFWQKGDREAQTMRDAFIFRLI